MTKDLAKSILQREHNPCYSCIRSGDGPACNCCRETRKANIKAAIAWLDEHDLPRYISHIPSCMLPSN